MIHFSKNDVSMEVCSELQASAFEKHGWKRLCSASASESKRDSVDESADAKIPAKRGRKPATQK